jgi:multidrug efflux system membrane fusion protein
MRIGRQSICFALNPGGAASSRWDWIWMPERDSSETSSSPAAERRRIRKHSAWRSLVFGVIAILVVVVAVRFYLLRGRQPPSRANAAPPLPVTAVRAHRGDIGVYLTGLGSVTPLYTVTIKTRIDGELVSVGYREGQTVQKGASLVEIDPRPYEAQLAQAEAQLAKDQAALQNARTDLQRYQTLIAKNAIAQQIVATQQATVSQDEGAVKADDANIQSARLNISYCHITAPIGGRVGLRLVDPGNLVSAAAGTPLVVITQIQPISVIFTIPGQQLAEVLAPLRTGKHLRVDAFDSATQKLLSTGELTTVDNEIDTTTGTIKLRATLPNRDEVLFPNQFVNARLLVDTHVGVTLVPNAAIQRNGSATFLYVVKPDGTVTIRKVTIGATNADESEIDSGLGSDDVVVTAGVDKLQEGAHVRAQIQNETDAVTSDQTRPATAIPTSGSR